jgi:hypothetical protein
VFWEVFSGGKGDQGPTSPEIYREVSGVECGSELNMLMGV